MSNSLDELDKLYKDGEEADRAIFAEMRSNILLVNGDHYTRKQSQVLNSIRTNLGSPLNATDNRLRVTMNQIQVCTNTYVNNIVTYAPGVAILPKVESDLSCQKSAEMHNSVWQDLKDREKLNSHFSALTHDFIEIGEAHNLVRFDENAGTLIGYEQEVDDNGEPLFDGVDDNGVPIPVASERPVYNGGIKFERLLGPNIIRNANAKTLDESNFLCHRKMVSVDILKKKVAGDNKKLKYIEESQDRTFIVFDGSRGVYPTNKGMCMVREFYFRPSYQYPTGYYAFATDKGIIFEDQLPFGIFPIQSVGFKHVSTTPRAHSIIKNLRPVQAEMNRTVSKMAEHQVTLGDDKVLYPTGTKMAQGGKEPGIRSFTVNTASPPIVIPGRTGAQYLDYFAMMGEKMYEYANITEEMAMKDAAQLDINTQLFMSLRLKKKYSVYTNKIEGFFREIAMTSLKYAKETYNETHIIAATGKNEYINIPEFKKKGDLEYVIKCESQTDDIETKMGKHINISQILQYVGQSLSPEHLGLLIRNMPYVNGEQIFESLLVDYDCVTNDILALDRGEQVSVSPSDNHPYYINRLTLRMKKPDFRFMPEQIKQMYAQVVQQHEMFEQEKLKQLQLAESEFIPTTGYTVKADMYVTREKADGSGVETKRAELPYDALKWLLDKIQQQGMTMEGFKLLDPAAQAQIAQSFVQQSQGMQQPQMQEPQMMQQ